MNEPLIVKIIVAIITIIPSALGGGSILLQLKRKKKIHSECSLYPDLLNRDLLKEKIKDIKDIIILKEQMSVLASADAKILFIIRSEYLKLTENERDIDHYDKTLLLAKEEIKDLVRKWLRVNHYTAKTDNDFRTYKSGKITDMIDIVSYHLNRSHKNHFFEVTREALLEHNTLKVIPHAIKIWDKMFDDCREIARDYENKIAGLENELKINV